jgi:two-component system chemotaxis response regulator CheY
MGQRILIVDDAAFMRMMLKEILTKNGYEVVGEAGMVPWQLLNIKI